MLTNFHNELKTYDKNVFPVEGNIFDYSVQETERGKHILDLYSMLKEREYIIKEIRKLPSIAVDNLKKFIRTPRSSEYDFKDIANKLRTLNRNLESLPKPGRNDDDEAIAIKDTRRNTLLKKIFNSKNSFEQMVKNTEQFAYVFNNGSEETGKEEYLKLKNI